MKENMNSNLYELTSSSKNILLLQGPIGSFFKDLSNWLEKKEKVIYKVNFNGGDELFYPQSDSKVFSYTDMVTYFSHYLYQLCKKYNIDTIVCFGDNRRYHKIAKNISDKLNISFWVFEEGYFRPEYITLEKYGVNNFSVLPRNANFFLEQSKLLCSPNFPQQVTKGFCAQAIIAIKYYAVANFTKSRYPNYKHHRELGINYYIKHWVKSGVKKISQYVNEKLFAKYIQRGGIGKFFIVALQVHNDTQVTTHSDYNDIVDFIIDVLESFIKNAPDDVSLVIKHHPMDRGMKDYSDIIGKYQNDYPQYRKRIYYIYDVPMPILLRKAEGMVTLNSTSGISALLHSLPVITLGRSNYDFEGLTYQGKLDTFWKSPTLPNEDVFCAYRKYHLHKTQINGSFYSKVILK